MSVSKSSQNLLTALPAPLTFQLFANAERGRVKAGEVLFSAGDASLGCYGIEQGLIKIVPETLHGSELITAIRGPGAIIGEFSMIDGGPRVASAIVLQDCIYRFVSRDSFQKFEAAHPEIYRELVVLLTARLRQVNNAVTAIMVLSGKGRVARALLQLAEHVGERTKDGPIVLSEWIGQNDIAAMTGLAREHVSRILAEWRRRGLVTQASRCHVIRDPDALRREMEVPSVPNRGRSQGDKMK